MERSCVATRNGRNSKARGISPEDQGKLSSTSASSSARSSPVKRNLRKSRSLLWNYVVVVIACGVVYSSALHCGFVFDDISAVRDNKDLRPETPIYRLFLNDFWGTPMNKEHSHKSYRPFTVLSFRLTYFLHGLEPFDYHLTNVLLHAVTSCLLMYVVTEFVRARTAFVCGLLFAVHPIHTEAVTGVVGRAECLCAIFFLAAFVTYRISQRRPLMLAACVLSTFAAALCKEQGITVLGVCMAYELFVVRGVRAQQLISIIYSAPEAGFPQWLRRSLLRCFFLLVAGGAFMYARIRVMGSQLPVFTKFDNPAAMADFPARQLTFNYLLPINFWLLLNPLNLCCDWTMGTIPLVTSLSDPRIGSIVLFYVALTAVVYRACVSISSEQYRVVVFALSVMVFSFLPASNLLFPVGFVVAERVLYLPSMGFSLMVALGCERLRGRWKRIVDVVLVVTVLSHAGRTFWRNFDWVSDLSIFQSAVRVNVNNAKLYNNIGHALEQQGLYGEALRYFRRAAVVQPDDVGAHINVGRTLTTLKMFDEAEQVFLTAKSMLPRPRKGERYQTRIAPNYLGVFLSLANLYARNSSRLEEADALYRQAISMRADYIQAYINRGDVLIKMNRTQDAWRMYEIALRLDSSNPDIYYNMGVVLIELGKPSEAMEYFEKALQVSPGHEQALMNSAILIHESGNAQLRELAVQRLNQLLQKGHDDERIWFNLAMLATDNRRFADAERYFKLALKHKPNFRSARFNLALLLSDVGRPLEAKPHLEQLLEQHPNHTRALILLGDIFINQLKDTKRAKQCYERILINEPDNIQAAHNLCVVYVNSGQLEVAEECLQAVQKKAPNEKYISKHLEIVRKRIDAARRKARQPRTP